jgi:putative oxidoreductase
MDGSRYLSVFGRVLLTAIFLASGLGKIAHPADIKGYMAQAGMPAVGLFFIAAVLFELGGGLSVLLGYKAKFGAIALMLFLVPTTLIFHNFWAYSGGAQQEQIVNFLKNLAIFGGLAMIVAYGPGPFSLDNKLQKGEAR